MIKSLLKLAMSNEQLVIGGMIKFFPDRYVDLLLDDKPDLRDTSNGIGIEVTSAIPQNEQEAMSLACEIPILKRSSRINESLT